MISPAVDAEVAWDGASRKAAVQGVIFQADLAESGADWRVLWRSGQTLFTVFDLAGEVAYDHVDISATCAGSETRATAVTAGRGLDGRAAAVALLFACTVTGADASSQQNRFDRRSPGSPRRRAAERRGSAAEPRRRRDVRQTDLGFRDPLEQRFLQSADRHVRAVYGHDRSVEPDSDRRPDVRSSDAARWPNGPFARRRGPLSVRRDFSGGACRRRPVSRCALRVVSPLPRATTTSMSRFASGRRIRSSRGRRLKAAVLKQPLTVPDFWTGEPDDEHGHARRRHRRRGGAGDGRRCARAAVRDRHAGNSSRHGLHVPARTASSSSCF